MAGRAQESAARGIKTGARMLREQAGAYAAASQKSDREQAEETAKVLLEELSGIEAQLKMRAMQEGS